MSASLLGRFAGRYVCGAALEHGKHLSASLVNVCDAALKGIADQSRAALKEMRAALGLTVSCTLYHSCARAGQEGAELVNVPTNATDNGCLVCLLVCSEIAHLRLVRVDR